MDKIKITIVVLVIWCVGATFFALNANAGSNMAAGEREKLQAEIVRKDREISQLKELVEAVEKRSRTRSVSDKTARSNFQDAAEQASQEKETGRGFRATPIW